MAARAERMNNNMADCVGEEGAGRLGSPTFKCRQGGGTNWGGIQTLKPKVSAWETED